MLGKNNYFKIFQSLIGVFRANENQLAQFKSAIEGNNWTQYKHIQLIIEEPENEGWYLDVDYVEKRNTIIKGSNLSCCIVDENGNVLWKRYENEWNFSSDADEIEQELEKILIEKQIIQQQNVQLDLLFDDISNLSQDTYRNLKKLVKSQILNEFKDQRFTRQISLTLQKQTFYKNGQDRIKKIMQPEITIESSKKSFQQTEQLFKMVQKEYNKKLVHIQWDKQLLNTQLSSLIQSNNLNVQISLDKVARIVITPMEINSFISPWEQSPIIPYYPSTDFIFQAKNWLAARETLLPQLQEQQSSDSVQARINDMKYNFFRQIPGVQKTLNEKYGLIPYVEKRNPPYEDMSITRSQGSETIQRSHNKLLLVFLIDYENDDSIMQLKDLIEAKKNNFEKLQIVVVGHIRVESWTKLFQAFIDKQGLEEAIRNNIIETWFPVEDKISGVSFLAIIGRIYGMILEKRDCMIIDKWDVIRYLDSSRRCVPNLSKIINEIETTSERVAQQNENQKEKYRKQIDQYDSEKYRQQWQQMKRFIRENNEQIMEICTELQNKMEEDDEMVLIEQKENKVRSYQNKEVSENRLFNKGIIKIKGCSGMKEYTKRLLNKLYEYIPSEEFDIK